MFKSTSTPIFGLLSDIADLFGGRPSNPRRTQIDEYDDRPIGSDYYVPRRSRNIASNTCDVRIWIDEGYQSRRAYRFAVAIIDRFDLKASYKGAINSNVSNNIARSIANAAVNYGLDVSQRSGNGYSYMDIHDNGETVVSIRRENMMAW